MSVASVDTGPDPRTEHTCQRCGRIVPKKPKGGRPFQHCPDSPDRPGTSCLDLAKEERAALDRAGLGDLLAAFRADRDAVRAAVAPALGPVTALVEVLQQLDQRLDDVEQTTIARAEQAEAARVRAEAAQRTAEREHTEAEGRTRRAYELRDEALAERDLAADDAQRHQRDADAAINRAVNAEHARGQAEGAAAEQLRALDAEIQRRTGAEDALAELREHLAAVQRDLAAAGTDLAEAERVTAALRLRHQEQLHAAETQIRELSAQAERHAAAASAQVADAEHQRDDTARRLEIAMTALNDLGPRAHRAEQAATEATSRADQLQTDLLNATADTDRRLGEQHAKTAAAETRYHDLLQSLATGGFARVPGDDTGPQ